MKKEEKKRIRELTEKLQQNSAKRCAEDLAELRKPYYYKGRFNSLKPAQKRQKIREYYRAEKENIKSEINDLLTGEQLRTFSASVVWVNNRIWGMNPTARVWVNGSNYGEGRASGCGYDKLSSAIQSAITDDAEKIIFGEVLRTYAATGQPLPYGVGYFSHLYIDFGGCGVSTLRHLLEYCGLSRFQWNETKKSDFISATRA